MLIRSVLTFLLLLAAATPALAATVTVGSQAAVRGATIVVPVNLTSSVGENPAGLQFDLTYNTSVLTFVSYADGPVSTAAGKFGSSSNPSAGVRRVVIFGLNPNVIGNGVVCNLTFTVQTTAPVGLSPLTLSAVQITDPNATPLPNITPVSGSVDVSASAYTLSVGSASAQRANIVTIPITLTANVGVNPGNLQYDVTFNGGIMSFSSYSNGPVTTAAGKTGNATSQSFGVQRITISGTNQTAIANGVVSNLSFLVDSIAPAGPYGITLSAVTLTDPQNNPINPSATEPGVLTVETTPISLSVPALVAQRNQNVTIPVTMTVPPGGLPAAVRFDLTFNTTALTFVAYQDGPATTSTGRSGTSSAPSAGVRRVDISGMGFANMTTGVISNLIFSVNPSAPFTTTTLGIVGITVTESMATPVPGNTATPGSIQIVDIPPTFIGSNADLVATPGTTVNIPVEIDTFATVDVSTCSFNVNFNQSQLAYISTASGASATAAGKTVSASTSSPGVLTVTVTGSASTPIANGELALITFAVPAAFTGGANASVTFTSLTASTPASAPVGNLVTNPGTVLIPQISIEPEVPANGARIGQQLILPLKLTQYTTGNITAGLQADIVFDPAVFDYVSVTAGPVATGAGKSVTGSLQGSGNKVRVVLFGLNANAMSDGIVANVTFTTKMTAQVGTTSIEIEGFTASNPSAVTIDYAVGFGSNVAITSFAQQDVNQDDVIDIVDVMAVVNIIVTISQPAFAGQGDVNQDNVVNILDVQEVVKEILNP